MAFSSQLLCLAFIFSLPNTFFSQCLPTRITVHSVFSSTVMEHSISSGCFSFSQALRHQIRFSVSDSVIGCRTRTPTSTGGSITEDGGRKWIIFTNPLLSVSSACCWQHFLAVNVRRCLKSTSKCISFILLEENHFSFHCCHF